MKTTREEHINNVINKLTTIGMLAVRQSKQHSFDIIAVTDKGKILLVKCTIGHTISYPLYEYLREYSKYGDILIVNGNMEFYSIDREKIEIFKMVMPDFRY